MKKTYKKFKVGALTLGAGVMSMFGGVACDTVHGAPIDVVSASAYGLNEGWVFRGEGHQEVKVFTKNYPDGNAVVAFDNNGNVKTSVFFRNNGSFGGFNATLSDPAVAHLFPYGGFMVLTDFSFSVTNGVKNVTFFGVHFTL